MIRQMMLLNGDNKQDNALDLKGYIQNGSLVVVLPDIGDNLALQTWVTLLLSGSVSISKSIQGLI